MSKKEIMFDKSAIEKLAAQINKEKQTELLNYPISVIAQAITNIVNGNIAITGYEILVNNDFTTDCVTENSCLDILLVLNSAQLEFNSTTVTKKHFKTFLQRVRNSIQRVRLENKNKKRRKKNKPVITEVEEPKVKSDKYNIANFKHDFVNELAKYLTPETYVYNHSTKILLLGREELGIKVNIYPTFKSNNQFKLYDTLNNKIITLNYEKRFENINDKMNLTNNKFQSMVRLFKNLYYHITNENLSHMAVESLIFNCPNGLFVEDDFLCFLNIINFLNMQSILNFKSIRNKEIILVKDKYINFPIYDYNKFLKKLTALI